jgi:hypothetical protein
MRSAAYVAYYLCVLHAALYENSFYNRERVKRSVRCLFYFFVYLWDESEQVRVFTFYVNLNLLS